MMNNKTDALKTDVNLLKLNDYIKENMYDCCMA